LSIQRAEDSTEERGTERCGELEIKAREGERARRKEQMEQQAQHKTKFNKRKERETNGNYRLPAAGCQCAAVRRPNAPTDRSEPGE
jgi:hypothetical protein